MSVLFFGEEQHACGALDGGGFKARCADTHHRAAENDLARGLDEAAALLGEVLKRSADAGESVYGSLEGAARDGDDTLDNGLALIAGLIYRVRGTGADNVAADAGGDPAGLDLAACDCLDLHLLAALGVLDLFGDDLYPVILGMEGIEKVNSVLLVLLDAVVAVVKAAGNTDELDALEGAARGS